MSVDITIDPVGRALYLHGPAGLQTLAADLERRGLLTKIDLPSRLCSMVASGEASVRSVTMAGQTVDLFYMAGNGIG